MYYFVFFLFNFISKHNFLLNHKSAGNPKIFNDQKSMRQLSSYYEQSLLISYKFI